MELSRTVGGLTRCSQDIDRVFGTLVALTLSTLLLAGCGSDASSVGASLDVGTATRVSCVSDDQAILADSIGSADEKAGGTDGSLPSLFRDASVNADAFQGLCSGHVAMARACENNDQQIIVDFVEAADTGSDLLDIVRADPFRDDAADQSVFTATCTAEYDTIPALLESPSS